MSQPYIGEIRMFGGSFAPAGWAFCDGQLLPISENETLFNLIGTTYGGDGQETFALPNLQSRIAFHQGSGAVLATTGGAESVTLTVANLPAHGHPLLANPQAATETRPAASVVPASPSALIYNNLTPLTAMNPGIVGVVGGSQPHDNQPPFLTVSFIISLFGVFPTQ